MFDEHGHRILAPADRHQHLALGAELDEHVGAFVDRPDVVLRVDAHRVREGEAVVVAADLADEGALRRVLEQPRLVGAVVDVDVALRVGGDAHVLAGVDARRVLEEVGHRFVRDHRHVGRRGPRLGATSGRGERHRAGERDDDGGRAATGASYARSSRAGANEEPHDTWAPGSDCNYDGESATRAIDWARPSTRRVVPMRDDCLSTNCHRRRSGTVDRDRRRRSRRVELGCRPWPLPGIRPFEPSWCGERGRLTPDHRARWGKFSVAGMLAHLNDATLMALGELPVQAKAPAFLRLAPVRYLLIHRLPFPKSAPTAPEISPARDTADLRSSRRPSRRSSSGWAPPARSPPRTRRSAR